MNDGVKTMTPSGLEKTKVICFMNNKGGCGKTTTVYSVGEYWAQRGKKILFIDLDSQASLTGILSPGNGEHEWNQTIMDSFRYGPELGLNIQHTDNPLIDFVPADLDLANFNEGTASNKLREWMLDDILRPVKEAYMYDFILVDCPPALGLIAYNALVASDYLIIVANADGLSYKGVQMVGRLYVEVQSNPRLNPELNFIGLVVTRFEKNNISNYYLKRFKQQFKIDVVEPCIRKSTKVVQAVSLSKSIYEIDPNGKATEDYRRVAAELLMRAITGWSKEPIEEEPEYVRRIREIAEPVE